MAKKQTNKVTPIVAPVSQVKNPPISGLNETTTTAGTPLNPLLFSIIVTAVFFVIASIGLLHHEMWRDEYQAWLVARDAHSLPGLLKNMRYEGNPALWHLFLFLITRVTHNAAYMQVLHLIIASAFIFVFNRYAEIKFPYKIMFSLGYFVLYEYTVISRSYGLAVLLIFIACALYKNRQAHYLLIGVVLALLSNVTIYGVIFAIGIYGILVLDQLNSQKNDLTARKKLIAGGAIVLIGVILALYQIIPQKDNSFGTDYPKSLFDTERWSIVFSRIFTTYFYVPKTEGINFWNTNYYYDNDLNTNGSVASLANTDNLLSFVLLPAISFLVSLAIFIRKPLILLLYTGITFGLLFVYYYTNLLFLRYCGFLLIILIVCYWLEKYYPEKKYKNIVLNGLADLGKKMQMPFLIIVLAVNIAGSAVAYSKDYSNEFSSSKDAANYIRENKLDSLTIAGINLYIISPLAAHLDTVLFYPQRNEFGSFIIYNSKLKWNLSNDEINSSIENLLNQGRTKVLLVTSYQWMSTNDGGKHYSKLEHGMMSKSLKMDFVKSFDAGIVADEQYYLYIVQKNDPTNYLQTANAFKDKKQYDSSIVYFNKLLNTNPENVQAHVGLGVVYLAKKLNDSAETHFNKAQSIMPADPGPVTDVGVAYFVNQNYPKALVQFKKTVSLDPQNLKGYSNLGRTYFVMEQYQTAIEIFSKERKVNPGDLDDINFIALSYQKIGKADSAKKYQNMLPKNN